MIFLCCVNPVADAANCEARRTYLIIHDLLDSSFGSINFKGEHFDEFDGVF